MTSANDTETWPPAEGGLMQGGDTRTAGEAAVFAGRGNLPATSVKDDFEVVRRFEPFAGFRHQQTVREAFQLDVHSG